MASQGANSPGTVVSVAEGAVAWTSPSNATSSNNSYASVGLDEYSPYTDYLKATGFGFSIPSGATIDGIKLDIEGLSNSYGVTDNAVRIVKGGTIGATDRSVGQWSEGGPEAYRTFGGISDKWGETWTVDDINNSGFGAAYKVEFFGGFGDLMIDHMRITVYYTEGGSSSSVSSINGVAKASMSSVCGLAIASVKSWNGLS